LPVRHFSARERAFRLVQTRPDTGGGSKQLARDVSTLGITLAQLTRQRQRRVGLPSHTVEH
jgi:hypothetical protein